jgi:putative copper resistance protein D
MSLEAANGLSRFLFDFAAMLLWGSSLFLIACVPAALEAETGRHLAGPRRAAVMILVLAIGAALPLKVAMIGNGWADAISPKMTLMVLTASTTGRAWLAQAAATLLVAAVQLLPAPHARVATALAAALALVSLTLAGHAAEDRGWLGFAHRSNDALHLLAAGAWIGGLAGLAAVLRLPRGAADAPEAVAALRRFAATAPVVVAAAVASGAVNAWLVVGRWPADWSTPYHALLAAKVALVAAMIAVAAVNRYHHMPRCVGGRQPAALAAIRRSTLVEIGLGAAAVGLISVFGTLDPA